MITVINYLGNRIGSGGIESFVTNASKGMKEKGIKYIVCVNYKTENIYEEQLCANGAFVEYLSKTDLPYMKKLKFFITYMKKYKDAILYLHASTSGMYFYAWIAKRCGIKNIVYHIHSTPDPNKKRLKIIKDDMLNFLWNDIPNIRVACSKVAGELFYKKNFQIVHNGIYPERFKFDCQQRSRIRKQLGISNEFVLGQIGRFSPPKNQLFTLDILKQSIQCGMNTFGIFIGEGKDFDKIQKYVEENHLGKKVKFILPTDKVYSYYSAFDVMMFPSSFEGLGIVALEAQAAGLPVICSEHIVKEVYLTDFIYKCKLNEPDSWINTIKKIQLEDNKNRNQMSLNGISACNNAGFSIDETGRELVNIYKDLLDGHK